LRQVRVFVFYVLDAKGFYLFINIQFSFILFYGFGLELSDCKVFK